MSNRSEIYRNNYGKERPRPSERVRQVETQRRRNFFDQIKPELMELFCTHNRIVDSLEIVGSVAQGEAAPESDLDLLLIVPDGTNGNYILDLCVVYTYDLQRAGRLLCNIGYFLRWRSLKSAPVLEGEYIGDQVPD